jgi:hypothetical protein
MLRAKREGWVMPMGDPHICNKMRLGRVDGSGATVAERIPVGSRSVPAVGFERTSGAAKKLENNPPVRTGTLQANDWPPSFG